MVEYIQNKRIMGIDFGLKRVGIAVSDKLHIAISLLPTLIYSSPNFWNDLIKILLEKKIGCIVLGVPFEENEENHPLQKHINDFENKLQIELDKLGLKILIVHQDESYSSRNAVSTMLEIGTKKKKRSKKGSIDAVSAGLILQRWIETFE